MREEECRAPSTSFQMVFLGKIIIRGSATARLLGLGYILAFRDMRVSSSSVTVLSFIVQPGSLPQIIT